MKSCYISFLILISISKGMAGVILSFEHFFEQKELVLDTQEYRVNGDKSLSISLLKYYVGNVEFVYESGKTYSDSTLYHLIDLNDSTTLSWVYPNLPEGELKSIKFGIGVDSTSNDEGLMDGDLDPLKGMYWAWSSGFINFKLEGALEGNTTEEFKYHIGGFIPPNQSYQSTLLAVDLSINEIEVPIKIGVELADLINEIDLESTLQILSPSLKAKEFSGYLPKVFKVLK